MTDNILAVLESDTNGISKESRLLLGEADRLSKISGYQLNALAYGEKRDTVKTSVDFFNLDTLYFGLKESLEYIEQDAPLDFLSKVHRELHPKLTILSSSIASHYLATNIAVRFGYRFISNCVDFDFDENYLNVRRSIFQGVAHSIVSIPLSEQIVVTTDCTVLNEPDVSDIKNCSVKLFKLERSTNPKIRTVGFTRPESVELNVEESDVIIGVGGGASLQLVENDMRKLALALKGCIGGTRVAVDLGLIPFERQIGSSGHNVSSNCYFACGISGALHHTSGLREVDNIIAINSDENAPIMRIAKLAIVGKCEDILPELLDLISHDVSEKT